MPRSMAAAAGLSVLLAASAPRAETTVPEPGRPVDYNAPAPDRRISNYARALANLGISTWFVWQFDWFRDVEWIPVTRDSIGRNLKNGLSLDEDELQQNFFGHPYQGALMFSSARAAGLGFWESVPYAGLGSVGWEVFGEREPPSANDLVMTTLAGVMLGEMTYRLSSELLDDTESGASRLLRELGAATVSPVRGFDRLVRGRAFSDGPPPRRYPVSVSLHAGLDRVRVEDGQSTEAFSPTFLFAASADYGDLAPRSGESTLDPFEHFELYAAAHLFNQQLRGAQIYSTGLLAGWSAPVSTDRGVALDNNVFGFAMTYEFQGANVATYGGAGIGPADYLTLRLGHRRWLRLGIGLDVVPIVGVKPSDPVPTEPAYNFSTGGATWGTAVLDLDQFGRFRLRSRHYLAHVLQGVEGADYLGATRLSYDLDAPGFVGFGVAPMLIHRVSLTEGENRAGYQLEMQAYLRVHN